jgi:hypothetical protein
MAGVSELGRIAFIASQSYWNSLPRHANADNNRGTIETMLLAMFAMRVLEVMFFVGLVGSSIVVLISFVEDGKELFGKDE